MIDRVKSQDIKTNKVILNDIHIQAERKVGYSIPILIDAESIFLKANNLVQNSYSYFFDVQCLLTQSCASYHYIEKSGSEFVIGKSIGTEAWYLTGITNVYCSD